MDLISILRELAYLVAAATFIIGLKRLSSPATARSGNQLAAAGMLLAVLATFLNSHIQGIGYAFILVGMAIGGGIGFYLARTVQMTAMPQMVALFNGMGGGAAAFSSISEYLKMAATDLPLATDFS